VQIILYNAAPSQTTTSNLLWVPFLISTLLLLAATSTGAGN